MRHPRNAFGRVRTRIDAPQGIWSHAMRWLSNQAGIVILALAVLNASQQVNAQGNCNMPCGDCGGVALSSLTVHDLTEENATCYLCRAAFFAEYQNGISQAGCNVLREGLTFDEVLPPSYVVPDRYHDGAIRTIIQWASDDSPLRTAARDEILLEASFRYASAHAMFGDDGLMRGLNAVFDDATSSNPLNRGILRMDSRVCGAPNDTSSDRPCMTDSDCSFEFTGIDAQTCGAQRFGANGIYGAVQEYRRAEGQLLHAVQVLGRRRFLEIDRSTSCPGGCASRLLVRVGAQRARAQAERVDALWQKAIAGGQGTDGFATCTGSPSGRTCQLDRDCGAGSLCGTATERGFVMLRQAGNEALAEATAAQAFYQQLFGDGQIEGPDAPAQSDWALLQVALSEVTLTLSRTLANVSPFGVPSDYVPVLTQDQKDLLGCGAGCGPACNFESVVSCLKNLATGGTRFDSILDRVEGNINKAKVEQESFATAVSDTAERDRLLRSELRAAAERMFGAPESGPGARSCTAALQEQGRCFTAPELNNTWFVDQVACDDDDHCDTSNVDGELERQFQAIRAAELSLDGVFRLLDDNDKRYEKIGELYARRADATTQACNDISAAIRKAQQETQAAYKKYRKKSRGGLFGSGALGSVVKVAAIVAVTYFTAGTGTAATAAALASGSSAATGAVLSNAAADQASGAASGLSASLANIQANKELRINAIQCNEKIIYLGAQEEETLLGVQTERERLLVEADRARQAILDAVIQLNQLLAQLRQARVRFDEARTMDEVWRDGLTFRNPQNYRPLALDRQLRARRELRTAQLLTWMILRAAAYDLAEDDLPVAAGACVQNTAGREPLRIGGSDGSCSLGAVFAARSVDDLRDLIRVAQHTILARGREPACETSLSVGGANVKVCRTTVPLRDLFRESQSGSDRSLLGGILWNGSPDPQNAVTIDFGITLDRRFRLCAQGLDGVTRCQASGLLGASDVQVALPEERSLSDVWNSRVFAIAGVVKHPEGRQPYDLYCRFPSTGRVASEYAPECANAGSRNRTCLPASCRDGDDQCRCGAINVERVVPAVVEAQLFQYDGGFVRTSDAARIEVAESTPERLDRFRRYRLRKGTLLPAIVDIDQGEVFARTGRLLEFVGGPIRLHVEESVARSSAALSFQGLPLSSLTWRLRIPRANNGFTTQAEIGRWREFVESIEDIELIFYHQGFDLPTDAL